VVTLISIVGGAFELSVYTIALVRGGRPERIVATALAISYALVPLLQDRSHVQGVQYGVLFCDVVALLAVLYCVITTQRRWLLVGAAFQLLSVLCHFAAMQDGSPNVWGYLTAVILCGLGLDISLLAGTVFEAIPAQRRLRR
jgi:Na+/melibiose symporter-like transporter